MQETDKDLKKIQEIKEDLKKMKPKVFEENEVLNLTPEKKLDHWSNIIKDKVLDGNIVKLYADIESTGFAFWKRGRAMFDKVMDEAKLRKDAEKFFIEIESITNKNFLPLTHPMCKTNFFQLRTPTAFSFFVLGENIFNEKNINYEDIKKMILDFSLDESFYENLLKTKYNEISKELTINAKIKIKNILNKSYKSLEKEAIDLSGKVDRMIEFAFVACYENKDGETKLLKDEDGDLIYFHEFIYPNEDNSLKKEQIIENMPLIPYIIHKTSFEFLRGEESHPFLDIKLNKKAPTSKVIINELIKMLTYDVSPKEQKLLSENIIMFFHNGNDFDVPFIDAEMSKFYENKKLRDIVQVYDTLKISKTLIPSNVQKFISFCQTNKNFGGDESKKLNEDIAVAPTSKSLDNIKKLAAFLIEFDPEKPVKIYEKSQEYFFNNFKKYFEENGVDWNKFENMLEYSVSPSQDLSLLKGMPKPLKGEDIYNDLYSRYLKYLDGRKEYVFYLNRVKAFEYVYNNLQNIKKNIEENEFLKDALYRLNNTDRSSHGARVDSQLFMDAFIVLENAFYLKPKLSKIKRHIELEDIKLTEEILKIFSNKE